MATQLYVLANNSTQKILLTNQETSSDTTSVGALAVTHTGGKDGDYCNIPDCSDGTDFDDHHMTIQTEEAGFTIALWNNDVQNHLLYYSLDGTYTGGQPIQGSSQYQGISILVIGANDIRFFIY